MVTSHSGEWTFQKTKPCQKRSGRPMSRTSIIMAML